MTQATGGPEPQGPPTSQPPSQPQPLPQSFPQSPPQQGTIRLTLQGNELTAGWVTPTVVVSGHRLNSRFGTMDVPVWAGPNRVDVSTQWMREYGQASLEVVVRPGEVVPVFYAVPWHRFTTGSIGSTKQPRKGVVPMVVGIAVLLLALVLLLTL